MAKTLEGAYKQLAKQTVGRVVAKIGFELGDRIVAYVASVENWGTDDAHAMIMRHDNYRKDLKQYKYCEVVEEYDQNCADFWMLAPNDMMYQMRQEMEYDFRKMCI